METKKYKVVSIFLLLILLLSNPLAKAEPIGQNQHIIAGHGPVTGDLFRPNYLQIWDQNIYVLDQYAMSSFDLKTKKLKNRFPVDLGYDEFMRDNQDLQLKNTKEEWLKLFKDPTKLKTNLFSNQTGCLSVSSFQSYFAFDSKGRLFILGYQKILVMNPMDGSIEKSISLENKMDTDLMTESKFYRTAFRIFNDKLFLFRSYYDLEKEENATRKMYIFDLDGNLEKEIAFKINNKFFIVFDTFQFIPDLDVYGFTGFFIGSDQSLPLFFFDGNGNLLKLECDQKNMNIDQIEFQEPETLLIAGSNKEKNTALMIYSFSLKIISEGSITIKLTNSITIKEGLGQSCYALASNANKIAVIASGPMGKAFNSSVLVFQDGKTEQYGVSPYQKEEVFDSIAFTTDETGYLFTSNLWDPRIHQFDKKGVYFASLDVDPVKHKVKSRRYFYTLNILDLVVHDDLVYFSTKDMIFEYSIKSDELKILYDEMEWSSRKRLWFNLQMHNDVLYQLDSNQIKNKSPMLTSILDDNKPEIVELKNTIGIDSKNPPFFTSFKVTDTEYLFLDCVKSDIWVYSKETGDIKEKISLPNKASSFYSSFDLYPDGSILLTDVINNNLLHVSRSGELLETIGSKGQVDLGNTKEAYLEKPDQFYIPIRAKIANNHIYVSDFGNCRYHIIPIEKPEPKPTIKWDQESLKLDKFSIFSEKIIDLPFTVTPTKEFPFTLNSSVPWIQLKSDAGKSTDQKISLKILGDKLTPWQTNQGTVQITFPDYPELNKLITTTVDTIGNIVKVTIGSNIATLNDQEITLDSASIPLLKQGRTFVGIRLMGELVFSNTAKISYDAKTQTVYFEIGSKKIELVINQPFALVNGSKVPLDAPPFIQAGRTFVPLRFVSESLDASVEYDSKAQSITITYPGKK